jgi:hypothetical protein
LALVLQAAFTFGFCLLSRCRNLFARQFLPHRLALSSRLHLRVMLLSGAAAALLNRFRYLAVDFQLPVPSCFSEFSVPFANGVLQGSAQLEQFHLPDGKKRVHLT